MKQKNVVLMAVAVGCGLVAAFLTTQINAKPKVETVDVIVASKDLTTGTYLTKENWEKVTERRALPKEGLNPKAVTDPADLLDKRLARTVRKGEPFNSDDLKKGLGGGFLDDKDVFSMPIGAVNAAAGGIGPGSKVDVMASVKIKNKVTVMPLLVNMHVLEVNGESDLMKAQRFPNMTNVSFAVNQEEAALIMLAKLRGCHLELVHRNPKRPIDPDYSVQKVKAILESEPITSDGRDGETGRGTPETPVAPAAADKPATVPVLVATDFIPANTELTKDLVEARFQKRDMPKEYADGAVADLTPYLGQALKTAVARGQWVTPEMVGHQASKAPPPEEWHPPKPEPRADAGPAPKTAEPKAEPVRPSGLPTRDVTVTSASATMVHRFRQQPDGTWKLERVLTLDEANRRSAPEPTPDPRPAAPTAPKFD
ncbi:MAG: Flp pilus assembly protein CpaB [Isosphaera sp.]|nr:Flp pilus assembly protein CpaB [Isosphaera sp.]